MSLLPYLILVVPMREYLEKHLCMTAIACVQVKIGMDLTNVVVPTLILY